MIKLATFVLCMFPLCAHADADRIIEQNSGSICGMFADATWGQFNEWLQRYDLPLERVVMVPCNVGRSNLRDVNAYTRIIASNSDTVSFIQHINRYLIRNGHQEVFTYLVEGHSYQANVFDEILNAYNNSGTVRQSGYVAAAQMICTRIVGRNGPNIESLVYLYDGYCTSGPLALDRPSQ